MSLTVTEAAILDLQQQGEAMAKRAMTLGQADPTVEEITEYDRRRFGTAVRFEIDVCQPLHDIKREINMIRGELTNCLAILEQKASGNARRHMVHMHLASLRGELRFERLERKSREKRQPIQPE
jgi:hypothetical protein